MNNPKWDDTEEVAPSFDETSAIEDYAGGSGVSGDPAQQLDEVDPRQRDAMLRGAITEATFGLDDEVVGTVGALTERGIPLSGEDLTGLLNEYQAQRDLRREETKMLEETYPKSFLGGQVAGGAATSLIPGLGLGKLAKGAGALARGAQGAPALGTLAKEGAKAGAKYGTASGAGRSEAELLDGDIGQLGLDVAAEGALGAATGGVLPVAPKALTATIKSPITATRAIGRGLNRFSSVQGITESYKYGRAGRVLNKQNLDEDSVKLGQAVLDRINEEKDKLDISGVRKLFDDAGVTVNTAETFDSAIGAIEELARRGTTPGAKNAEEILKRTRGDQLEIEKLLEQTEKSLVKKRARSPDTKFMKPEVKIDEQTNRPYTVIRTEDGKIVDSRVGDIISNPDYDLKSLRLDEVDDLIGSINEITKIAQNERNVSNAVMSRLRGVAKDLRERSNEAMKASGLGEDLINQRKRFSDIGTAEDLLGVSDRLALRGDVDEALKATQIGGKLTFPQGFKSRQESELAKKLVPEALSEVQPQAEQLQILNSMINRQTADDKMSKAGLVLGAATGGANLSGRLVKSAADFASDITPQSIKNLKNAAVAAGGELKEKLAPALEAITRPDGTIDNARLRAVYSMPLYRNIVEGMTPLSGAEQSEFDADRLLDLYDGVNQPQGMGQLQSPQEEAPAAPQRPTPNPDSPMLKGMLDIIEKGKSRKKPAEEVSPEEAAMMPGMGTESLTKDPAVDEQTEDPLADIFSGLDELTAQAPEAPAEESPEVVAEQQRKARLDEYKALAEGYVEQNKKLERPMNTFGAKVGQALSALSPISTAQAEADMVMPAGETQPQITTEENRTTSNKQLQEMIREHRGTTVGNELIGISREPRMPVRDYLLRQLQQMKPEVKLPDFVREDYPDTAPKYSTNSEILNHLSAVEGSALNASSSRVITPGETGVYDDGRGNPTTMFGANLKSKQTQKAYADMGVNPLAASKAEHEKVAVHNWKLHAKYSDNILRRHGLDLSTMDADVANGALMLLRDVGYRGGAKVLDQPNYRKMVNHLNNNNLKGFAEEYIKTKHFKTGGQPRQQAALDILKDILSRKKTPTVSQPQ